MVSLHGSITQYLTGALEDQPEARYTGPKKYPINNRSQHGVIYQRHFLSASQLQARRV